MLRRFASLGLILALLCGCTPAQKRTAAQSTLSGLGAGVGCAASAYQDLQSDDPAVAALASLACALDGAAAAIPSAPSQSPAPRIDPNLEAQLWYLVRLLTEKLADADPRAVEAVREAREYVRGFIPLAEHMSELDAAMFVEDARIWLDRMDCAAALHTPAPVRP